MPNLNTTLKRRQRAGGMTRYDALPCELRAWLREAALPWSASSALELWRRDPENAIPRLRAAEARMLARDAPRIWGDGYPNR